MLQKFSEFLHTSQQLFFSFCTNGSQTSAAEEVADVSVTEPTLHAHCSFIAYREKSEWVIKFPRYVISVWTETAWMCFKASNKALIFPFLIYFFFREICCQVTLKFCMKSQQFCSKYFIFSYFHVDVTWSLFGVNVRV